MKKVIKIEVDCAVCAQKCEDSINKVDGVNSCKINFITQKMTIDYVDESILSTALKVARKIEPDFYMDI